MIDKKHVHMSKHQELADKNVPNLNVMQPLNVEAVGRSSLPGDTSSGTLRMRASSTSEITYTYVWKSCLPSHPETGRPQPKGPQGE